MDARTRRVGENEALFREINERLEGLNEAFSTITDKIEFVCECAELGCIDRFPMTVAEYEQLREDPTTFAVKPGHEAVDVEEVVANRDTYVVIRKKPGDPAALAAANDPRS